ncbi:MAG: SufE family protein [Oscillospiraceae bacterium]|nr:SufE family protein [Oscillospiraceae bacterium]
MKSIQEIENHILEDFKDFTDPFDQYAYLVEIACLLPAMPEDERTDDRLISGCQSKVWVKAWAENGVFRLKADSNTLIMRGILYLVWQLLDGQPVQTVAETDVTLFQTLSVINTLESARQKGIGYILAYIKNRANLLD